MKSQKQEILHLTVEKKGREEKNKSYDNKKRNFMQINDEIS